MSMVPRLRRTFAALRRREEGVALVEFAILLPVMLLIFAVIIEGGKMMWTYQGTIAGVRDATRYLSRVAAVDICDSGGSLAGYTTTLEDIVRTRADGASMFPSSVTVTAVEPSLACVAGDYRHDPAPVATVAASLTITFPFSGIFRLNGGELLTINTVVRDQARIYGS